MPALRDLQDAMRRSILAHDDADAAAWIVGASMSAAQRLSVYRNTFTQTLIRALRLSYPAIDQLVGAEFFDAAAHEFALQQPPHSGYLDEYGEDFANFLAQFAPAASVPYLPDVARVEWAVSRALHAPDARPLSLAALSGIDAANHARLCFVPHPSLGLVRAAYPADTIWRAVLADDDAALAAIDLSSGPVWLIVQRGPSGVAVERLSEPLWCFADALCTGQPLGAVLNGHPEVEAPAALATLFARERFAGFRLTADAGLFESSGRQA